MARYLTGALGLLAVTLAVIGLWSESGSTPALGEHVAWPRGPATGSDQP